jgi:hypothetical protein
MRSYKARCAKCVGREFDKIRRGRRQMFLMKLGLFACAFYAALTIVLEAAVWAMIRVGGIMYFLPRGKDLFWYLGLAFGVLFGVLWAISFSVAWWLTYKDLKPILQQIIK